MLNASRMIFITGASRSGTTLLSFVLRNHSQVFGLKELHYFGERWDPRQTGQRLSENRMVSAAASMFARQAQGILTARPTRQDHERARILVASLTEEDRNPAGLFAQVATQLSAAAGKEIPCEQTPRNIFYVDALLRAYPEARVVHMLRDPRAVMASQKQRWRRRRLIANKTAIPLKHSLRAWINYHPYTVGKLWCRASRAAQRLQDHPRFTLLRFEDLLEFPEATVRFMCGRLGLEFEPEMLEIGQINSSHRASSGIAEKGFNKDAMEAWRAMLSGKEIEITERICGSLMSRYGYATNARGTSDVTSELRYRLTYLLHIGGAIAVNPLRAWVQMQAAFTRPTRQGVGNRDGP